MTCVGRNNYPTELNAPGMAGDNGENCGGGARLKGMFTPPWVSFGDPEGVETCVLAGLGHGCGFVDGLHAELKNSDVECDGHSMSGLRSYLSSTANSNSLWC